MLVHVLQFTQKKYFQIWEPKSLIKKPVEKLHLHQTWICVAAYYIIVYA